MAEIRGQLAYLREAEGPGEVAAEVVVTEPDGRVVVVAKTVAQVAALAVQATDIVARALARSGLLCPPVPGGQGRLTREGSGSPGGRGGC